MRAPCRFKLQVVLRRCVRPFRVKQRCARQSSFRGFARTIGPRADTHVIWCLVLLACQHLLFQGYRFFLLPAMSTVQRLHREGRSPS